MHESRAMRSDRRSRLRQPAGPRAAFSIAALLGALLATAAPVRAQSAAVANRRCLNCHAQEHLGTMPPVERWRMVAPLPGEGEPTEEDLAREPATRPELHLDRLAFGESVHADLRCTDCHLFILTQTLCASWGLKPDLIMIRWNLCGFFHFFNCMDLKRLLIHASSSPNIFLNS